MAAETQEQKASSESPKAAADSPSRSALSGSVAASASEGKEIALETKSLPAAVMQHVLNRGSHWDLLNASRVSKEWQAALGPPLKEFQGISLLLHDKKAKEIVDICLGSIKATQATLMAPALLSKLTLDDVTAIACSSIEHARVVFKSCIFYPEPKNPQTPKKTSKKTELSDPMYSDLTKFLNSDMNQEMFENKRKVNIYQSLLKISVFNFDGLAVIINKLLQPDLLQEEQGILRRERHAFRTRGISVSSKVHENLLCQAYIARAVAEKSLEFAVFAIGQSKYTLPRGMRVFPQTRLLNIAELGRDFACTLINANVFDPESLVAIASLNEYYARLVLQKNLSTGELNLDQIKQLGRMNETYMKLTFIHSINLISILPINLAKCAKKPEVIKSIVSALLNNTFYHNHHNPFFAKWRQTKPELAKLILDVWSMRSKKELLPGVIKNLMAVSASSRERILAIKDIDQLLYKVPAKTAVSSGDGIGEGSDSSPAQSLTSFSASSSSSSFFHASAALAPSNTAQTKLDSLRPAAPK